MNQFSTKDQLPYRARRHSPTHRALLGICGVLAIGTIAAACGSKTASPTTTKPAAPAPAGTSATTTAVDTTSNAKLGTILVNSKGFTLYRLNKDSMNKSVCTSACAKIWPPLLMTGSGSPVAGSGVTGLGSIAAAGGRQVTYNGMPLYTFVGDKSAGQVNGQDLTDTWGTWFVLVTKASTAPTTTAPAGGATTTTSPSNGGGGF
jgi:predicted lipoprotein with Yx(FWY)xxD motif